MSDQEILLLCALCKREKDLPIVCSIASCRKKYCMECAGENVGDASTWNCQECITFGVKNRPLFRSSSTPMPGKAKGKEQGGDDVFANSINETMKPATSEGKGANPDEMLKLKQKLEIYAKNEAALKKRNEALRREMEKKVAEEDQFKKIREEMEKHIKAMNDRMKEMQEQVVRHQLNSLSLKESPPISDSRNELAREEPIDIDSGDDSTKSKEKSAVETHTKAGSPSKVSTETDSTAMSIAKGITDAMKELLDASRSTSVHETKNDQLALTMIRSTLPELPTFNGDRDQWPLFEKLYESTSETGQYTDELNHLRLVKCLSGEAKFECQRLLRGMAGGKAIMNHLKKCYGDPEKILNEQINQLLKLKPPRDLEKYQLKPFVLELESFVINAESLERTDYLKQPYIMDNIAKKLRDEQQDAWGKLKKRNPDLTLRDLLDYLYERLQDASAQPPSERTNRYRDFKRVNAHSEKKVKCWMCNDEKHELKSCRDFKKMSLNDKRKLLREKGLCDCCLNRGHRKDECPNKRACNLDGCKEYHHRLLHGKSSNIQTKPNQPELNVKAKEFAPNAESSHTHQKSSAVLYKILPVILYGTNGKQVRTYAFLDDGSSVTLLDREIYEKLNLKGTSCPLNLKWTGGIVRKEEESMRVTCHISGSDGKKIYPLYGVRTVEKLDLAKQTVDENELKKKFAYLKGLPLESYAEAQPKILIGLKNVNFLASLRSRIRNEGEPVASKTKLGWTVYGATSTLDICAVHDLFHNEEYAMNITEDDESDRELHELVKSYFEIESFGTRKQHEMSQDDKKAVQMIEDTMKFLGSQYEIGLLWKNDSVKLPDNYPMAMRRLISLEKSLEKSPELKQWTIEKFRELLVKGYARKATDEDLNENWPRTWILPTFTVVNENKIPLKPRQVYDAAAKYNGVSLNSELISGPDLLVPLNAGLYRFRENEICCTADVTEMYNQIKLKKEDQQCQRLLWRDCETNRKPDVYVFSSLSFGPTCAPALAQAVKNCHAKKYEAECPEAVEGLIERTFMDDYFNSHTNVDDALRISTDAIRIMSEAGFQLGKFQSNSKELLLQLPEGSVSDALKSFEPDGIENVTKVLGMYWHNVIDCFTYRLHEDHLKQELATHDTRPTKRQVLRLVMKIFDPIGLISHFTVRGKMILQEIWKDGTPWDLPINERLLNPWKEWIAQLKGISNLKIPRKYSPVRNDESEIEIHVFVDASEKAYAACVYFRIAHNDQVYASLASAKAKVVPLKLMSIPRCELMAAVMGVRLEKSVRELHSLKVKSTTFWSDSKCVLAWINSDSIRFKQFVGSRISEILEESTRIQWRYVPSKLNVADDATKCNETEVKIESRWFNGPEFLYKSKEEWPTSRKEEFTEIDESECVLTVLQEPAYSILDEIKPRYLSNWRSLINIIGWMRRIKVRRSKKNLPNYLTVDELKEAENVIWREIQYEAYRKELKALKDFKQVGSDSSIYKLSPFLAEDGIIRMSTRLQRADLSYAAKNPPILPYDNKLVRTFISHVHEKKFHQGEESIIAEIRRKAWVINARTAVRKVARECQRCKNERAKPIPPKMSELPEYRFDIGVKPFTHVGIDCFGPIEVAVGRRREKRWGMIFVCMVTRAIYVELIESMSTDHCIMAIMSFLSNRGPSRYFYSDNGKNFQGSGNTFSKELKLLRDELGQKVAERYQIDWNFNPPWAPHFGGCFERMVQAVKRAMKAMFKSMKERVPTQPVVRAALNEAASIINSRPLTHTPVNGEDDEPLTPNDLLGQSNLMTIPCIPTKKFETCRDLFRKSQHLSKIFVEKWTSEYLPIISRRCKWFENVKPIEEDDIVIVINPTLPRELWKKGRIVKVYKGKDDQVRVVDVKMSDGKIKKRAAHYIAVLDIRTKNDSDIWFPTKTVENGGGHVTE